MGSHQYNSQFSGMFEPLHSSAFYGHEAGTSSQTHIQYHTVIMSHHNYPLIICESFFPSIHFQKIMSLTRPDENLNTPQQHQSWTHEVLCQLNANMDESPLHHQTPATWLETPTPQPGAVEKARMNTCQSNCETRNDDLQDSPRRQHPCNTQDENNAPSPPEREEISRRGSLRNRVCIINSFCVTDLKNYSTFVDLPHSSSESFTITNPSFNANHWYWSSNYLTMAAGATPSK